MMKKAIVFFCVCINSVCVFGATLPVDTVVLEAALEKIDRVGSGESETRDTNIVEEAKADLAMYFLENADKELSVSQIAVKCKEFVKNSKACTNFVTAYNFYMKSPSSCQEANSKGETISFNGTSANFEKCNQEYADTNVYNGDGTIATKGDLYGGGSLYIQCKNWIKSAKECTEYLRGYYVQKLSESDLSENDKKIYQCLSDKVNTGQMKFPISITEKECGKK